MGDAADAILNGECCQYCGEWLDEDDSIIIKEIEVNKNKLQIIYAYSENPEKDLFMFP